jgi:UDP-N-acetylglucosamine 2-epimerase (non-hydrolysing)
LNINKLLKILVVFGTRPEAIKMQPIINQLKLEHEYFDTKVCVTAQHRHMLDQVLKFFEIIPDIDLNLMKHQQDLNQLTSAILTSMRLVLNQYKPDLVLVHGDTTTTMATTLACFYAKCSVGHIEAGLRTYNLDSPFPEEFNRQLVSKISKYHFAPTFLNKKNLISEGIITNKIEITGNTVIDALNWSLKKIDSDSDIRSKIEKEIDSILNFDWKNNRFILVTCHRRENFGGSFVQISEAIKELASRYPNIYFIYPVHLNPNIKTQAYEILKGINNVLLVEPMSYEVFIYLIRYVYFIMTDSGGIQEEAPSLGKPVLVMRNLTERQEAIEAGTAKLIGNEKKKIILHASELLDNIHSYNKMLTSSNPYGDGFASLRIVNFLKSIV